MLQNDTEEPTTESAPAPEAVLATVGNELRVEILWILYDEYVQGPPYGLSFSELHSQISGDVITSQSNYHLQQLLGHFVKKTDGSYRLSTAGRHLCQAVRAGILHQPRERRTIDAEFDCHYCQTSVTAVFDEERVDVQYPNCEYIYVGKPVRELPLDTFEDERTAFEQFSKYIGQKILGFARGVCTSCGNSLGTEFHKPHELNIKIAQKRNKAGIDRSCTHCGHRGYLTVGMALLPDPGIVCFCHDHGVDVLSTPVWELEFAGTDKHVTVLSTDPWKVALQVDYDGDKLELLVDGDLNVLERQQR